MVSSLVHYMEQCVYLVDNDIKRIIAFSTKSLGYKVVAAGISIYIAQYLSLTQHETSYFK
jgi:NADH:ubiquinone oxidoreductase subunit 5 (subunit L)/multisubunit Na+/H+ antiporter MnhA subunit